MVSDVLLKMIFVFCGGIGVGIVVGIILVLKMIESGDTYKDRGGREE